MSGLDLIEALRQTGTGEGKLAVAERALRAKADATAEDVLAALACEPKVVGAATLEKAKRLAGGAPVKDFLGTPPKNAEESRIRTLGREIGEAIVGQLQAGQDRANELGVGIPGTLAPRKK